MIRNDEISLVALSADRSHSAVWRPGDETLAAMAEDLGLLALKKLAADLTLTPLARGAWRLTADWGASVVQPCVVTLAPVKTRLTSKDELTFTKELPDATGSESEMPEDETLEPLVPVIDLPRIVGEMVTLSLPLYPRAAEADFESAQFAGPGIAPMTDDDAKPLAGLAALRDAMAKDRGEA
ncbi:MAG: DUF177 domain-containing protein [Pseudomonadota bacterium]